MSAVSFDARVAALVARDHQRTCAETDRQFALLFLVQWVLGVGIALYVTPVTWSGGQSSVHPHVWAAVGLGGLLSALPAWLALAMPGRPATRHAVAIGQMGIGIVLIHLTSGRIETHFHVFGSLAFLAAYRDRTVLATATTLVVVDHLVRGLFWPYSVFGVATAMWWRPLEHAAWVVFEVVVLLANCARATEAARTSAAGRVALEDVNDTIEARVERRTAELLESRRALERANAELRTATERALESSRAKSTFLATVSHEVRTPMNGIIGIAELLRDTPLEGEQLEYVEIIDRSGHALLGIINDILDYSKLEAGKLEVEALELDVVEQVDHIVAVLAHAAARKQVTLGAIVAPDIPRRIVGDAGRLNQVLLNLVGNALKFTERGHVLVRLSKTGSDASPRLCFDIEDTGTGIAPDTLDRLFQPFTQADASTTRRFGGTGLGLAICRSLAELLGGTLTASSTLGAGSTFRFELGLHQASESAPAITAAPSLPAGRTLLVSPTAAGAILREQLHAWGFEADLVSVLPDDPASLPAIVIGIDLDTAAVARLQAVANGARIVSLQSPATPTRLCRALADEPVDPHPSATMARSRAERHADGDPDGPCVLVVEDNPVNQRIAIKMISRLGYRAHTAENGVEATRRARRQRYDLILMDCQMPEMDGYDATRAIRQMEVSSARTPIIALTANAMASDRERCLAAGMDDFLTKPLTMAALQQALDRVIDAGRTPPQSQASAAPV
jgi:two-component system sensor histidine kinase/response regulator